MGGCGVHVALFELGASLNMWELTVCMFVLIVFTYFMEVIIDFIEEVLGNWCV
jgi:hypothetical protein